MGRHDVTPFIRTAIASLGATYHNDDGFTTDVILAMACSIVCAFRDMALIRRGD